MAAGSEETRNPATCLTDDLIVEILSRLPVKSVFRFKCVSKHWSRLITHPDHRKKLPQTLAGFFYHTRSSERFPETARHFTNVTGIDEPLISPSLSFLPCHIDISPWDDITLLDCRNGLLLCWSAGASCYFVCNPATEHWVALSGSRQAFTSGICEVRLGFDPAVSPNFHVFQFDLVRRYTAPVFGYFIGGLEIYSSESGQWTRRGSGWSDDAAFFHHAMSTVFLNGFLHMFAYGHQDVEAVLVVDTKGNSWRTILVPQGNEEGSIGHSQGHLYYFTTVAEHDLELSVYVLEDYSSDEWIFKHNVMVSELLGTISFGQYNVITIHPECHLIFFVSDWDHTIRCYDMDSRKVHVIRNMGPCVLDYELGRCLFYVPLFSESLAALALELEIRKKARNTSIYSGTISCWNCC